MGILNLHTGYMYLSFQDFNIGHDLTWLIKDSSVGRALTKAFHTGRSKTIWEAMKLQYDNTRGAWLTQEGYTCTITERKEGVEASVALIYLPVGF